MVSSSSFTDKNWLATRKVPSPGSAAWFGIDLTKLNRRASSQAGSVASLRISYPPLFEPPETQESKTLA
ncbi:hypothetical protein AGR3A_Lc190014 [Agrobacterium tomkonis CFBP 6623]|uniref:Uncharacterized protein n=1 Tax=Agrobacterium tomkonis CFBP 6623 TaxID=1183432 RepID=A0A1S7S3K4_9HYPH|nr:hypothetical protein AGR3A_Lc190014 [Agrobacterium tomkonis CFBP 6623]